MDIREILHIKTGGHWLVTPSTDKTIFCREMFSEEHNDIKKMIFQFSEDRIFPNVQNIEKLDEDLCRSIMREMGELGLIGIDTPEEFGGTDLDKITACLITEGVGWGGSSSFGCIFGVQTGIGSLGIVFFGTPEQKKKYLPKLITGEWIAAYGLTEPSAGSDALSAKTTAFLSDDGSHYILNGEKQFISNGGWADVYTILAQVDGNKFSGFIVDRDTEGFTIGAEEKKMGMKGSSTTSLKFTDAKVPVENLLYEVGKGATIAFNALNIGRYKLASASVGGSKLAIRETIKYALERRQFGQPIAKFDSIIGKIADITVRTYVADTMLYCTVGMIQDAIDDLDKEDPKYYIKMGETMERFAIEASMAKVYGSETSDMVADNCLQIFGGYGFIEEYPIAMAYRDDRINRIWEGTNEINRAIISGYMMKKVLTEEISLRDFLKDLNTFIAADVQANSQDNFAIEKHAVQATKKLVVLIFQEALCEFGQDLKHEQQLSEAFADIFTHIYTSESVICRVQQTLSSNGTSNMPVNIAKINVAESLLEVRSLSAKCLNRIFSENVPTSIMRSVTKLHDIINLDTDTISLKKDLGEFMIDRKDYPF
jgi:alkylation response protein AidB-like acyl-CoA dehydrogenase|tara:strand:- start:2424 stop:4214 length:1791 start_codon:yes stop_codon:yes gene_type:complete